MNCSSPPGSRSVLVGKALEQELDDLVVPVRSAQPVVAVRADDLDVVAVEADDRGVEGAAAQVIDEDVPHSSAVIQRLVVQRGGHRLSQHVEDVKTGDLVRPSGSASRSSTPKSRGHGDDHVVDLARRC